MSGQNMRKSAVVAALVFVFLLLSAAAKTVSAQCMPGWAQGSDDRNCTSRSCADVPYPNNPYYLNSQSYGSDKNCKAPKVYCSDTVCSNGPTVYQVSPPNVTFPQAGTVRIYYSNFIGLYPLLVYFNGGAYSAQLPAPSAVHTLQYLDTSVPVAAGQTYSITSYLNSAGWLQGIGWIPVQSGTVCGANGWSTTSVSALITQATTLAAGQPLVSTECWGDNSPPGDGASYDFNDYFIIFSEVPAVPTPTPSPSPSPSPTPVPNSWWQAKDSDVQTNGNILSSVPAASYFATPGPGGFPGVPAAGGTTTFTPGIVSTTGWVAVSPWTNPKVFDYNYFVNQIPANAVFNTISVPNPTSSQLTTGGSLDPSGYYLYKYDGSTTGTLTLPATNFAARKVILLVNNANVNITGNINLTKGVGFFMLVASGNVAVDPGVGGTGPNLEGIYVANNFNTGTAATQLWVRGSVVANGGVTMTGRTLTGVNPALLFEYAPDQIMLFPHMLGARKINWREVAP